MASRKTSVHGIDLIKRFESFQPRRYLCPAGKPTIGYGHVILPREVHLIDAVLSEAQATALLAADLGRFEAAVSKATDGVDLTQGQFDACVALAFNIGAGAFAGSTLARLLRSGDEKGAMAQFACWNKSGGKVLAGLTRRRAAEAELFDSK